MFSTPRRAALLVIAIAGLASACGKNEPAASAAPAVAPSTILPPFQQEIASAKAEVTFPGVWKFGYRMIDRADTANGAHRAIEFHYTADSARGVPPRLLLIIRAYKKPAWEKVRVEQLKVSRLLASHGDDIYVFSIVTSNPYQVNTPSALRVDQMMLALTAETSPFKLSFKDAAR